MVADNQDGIIMQGIYKNKIIRSFDWQEFACGWGAAFVNIGVTYPIYKIIFRQMLHGIQITSAYDQLKTEGLSFLYRGMFPPLAQKTISLSIMFGVFEGTRRFLVDNFNANVYLAKIISGVSSGTVEAILLPFERIQTLLADAKFHSHFSNTTEAFSFVYKNHGFKEIYRGLVPVLWRNGPSNVMFFVLREEANFYLPETQSMARQTIQEFLAGATIGATTSTLFYPLNVIKVAMQSDLGHERKSMLLVFRIIYHERACSIKNFYRGCGFNAFRSFISWGIMNAVYEYLKKFAS